MTEADLPQVLALENACFPDPWSAGIFRSALADELECWLVAEDAGRILGYAGLQFVLDEGYLDNIAVDPTLQRSGIGSALLGAIQQEAQRRKLSFLSLEVRAGNRPAIALYTHFGFETLGIRPGYYLRPKEDALIMTKYFSTKEG